MRSYPRTAFVNQFNYKNATAFFTNAFKRKAALNKWSLFSNFVLVKERLGLFYVLSFSPLARHKKQPNPRKLG